MSEQPQRRNLAIVAAIFAVLTIFAYVATQKSSSNLPGLSACETYCALCEFDAEGCAANCKKWQPPECESERDTVYRCLADHMEEPGKCNESPCKKTQAEVEKCELQRKLAGRKLESNRRELAAAAGDSLKAIFNALARWHQGRRPGDPEMLTFPRTPAKIPCGKAHSWTAAEREAWAEIGFLPYGPSNFSFELITPEMDPSRDYGVLAVAVARAYGDLDCDGVTSLFYLPMGFNPDGLLYRAPGINSVRATE